MQRRVEAASGRSPSNSSSVAHSTTPTVITKAGAPSIYRCNQSSSKEDGESGSVPSCPSQSLEIPDCKKPLPACSDISTPSPLASAFAGSALANLSEPSNQYSSIALSDASRDRETSAESEASNSKSSQGGQVKTPKDGNKSTTKPDSTTIMVDVTHRSKIHQLISLFPNVSIAFAKFALSETNDDLANAAEICAHKEGSGSRNEDSINSWPSIPAKIVGSEPPSHQGSSSSCTTSSSSGLPTPRVKVNYSKASKRPAEFIDLICPKRIRPMKATSLFEQGTQNVAIKSELQNQASAEMELMTQSLPASSTSLPRFKPHHSLSFTPFNISNPIDLETYTSTSTSTTTTLRLSPKPENNTTTITPIEREPMNKTSSFPFANVIAAGAAEELRRLEDEEQRKQIELEDALRVAEARRGVNEVRRRIEGLRELTGGQLDE